MKRSLQHVLNLQMRLNGHRLVTPSYIQTEPLVSKKSFLEEDGHGDKKGMWETLSERNHQRFTLAKLLRKIS